MKESDTLVTQAELDEMFVTAAIQLIALVESGAADMFEPCYKAAMLELTDRLKERLSSETWPNTIYIEEERQREIANERRSVPTISSS